MANYLATEHSGALQIPLAVSNPGMICQTTPLTLSVPAADISPNHYSQQITKTLTKLFSNLSHHATLGAPQV